MPAFKRILMATDFGPETEAAVRAGAALARQLGASVHLLHVVKDPALGISTPDLYGIDWDQLRADMLSQAQHALIAQAALLSDVDVTTDAIIGAPAETIAARARDLEVDLVVMGTHGRSGVGHLLIGSVAERVIRLASCPVMTVRGSGAVRVRPGEGVAAEQAAHAHVLR